jgi:hypothetical protein
VHYEKKTNRRKIQPEKKSYFRFISICYIRHISAFQYGRQVRLHEYVDVFASLASPLKLPFPHPRPKPPKGKGEGKGESLDDAEEDHVRPKRLSPMVLPSARAVQQVDTSGCSIPSPTLPPNVA